MFLKNIFGRIIEFGRMIKFSHSIFALPFALAGAVLAGEQAVFNMDKLIWIIIAMVGARSAAMGFNRLVDKNFDAENPRTSERHLPAGRMGEKEIILFIVFFSLLFIFASFQLNMAALGDQQGFFKAGKFRD